MESKRNKQGSMMIWAIVAALLSQNLVLQVISARIHPSGDQTERKGKTHYHFLLIHGAGHGAWCWYEVATLLRATDDSHSVTALDMAGSGIDPKDSYKIRSIAEYFQPIMRFMDALPPKDKVILVGHSMAGGGIATAMENFPHKIVVAVFLCAPMPGPDLDLLTIGAKLGPTLDFMDTKFIQLQGPDNTSTTYTLFGPEYLSTTLYNLSPQEDLTLGNTLIRPVISSDPSPETKLTKENYGSVHRVYISASDDKVFKQDIVSWMLSLNPADEAKEIFGADHMVMFSKPHELSTFLLNIAANYSTMITN